MADVNEDRSQSALVSAITFMVISIVAVGIRFWSRIITRSKLWWDDWLALGSLVFVIAHTSLIIYWSTIGLGKHAKYVSHTHMVAGMKILYAAYIIYDNAITLPKLSALCFYARIFRVSKRFVYSLWTVGGIVVAWLFVAIISAIWQCRPISKAWNPIEPGHCINTYQWWLGNAISSVIIDAIILAMPLPSLWELQLSSKRKLLVLAVFICGYAVIAISIGRLVGIVQGKGNLDADVTYNIIPIGYWLLIEGPVSIVSVCLPSIFSFVKRGIENGPYSLISTKPSGSLKRLRTPNSNDEAMTPQYRLESEEFPEGQNITSDSKYLSADKHTRSEVI